MTGSRAASSRAAAEDRVRQQTPNFQQGTRLMKKDIHPAYGDATITCACGNVIKTRSTKKEMSVNTCSACHPYFTGQKTMVDTEGRVDSFKKRYAKFAK